MNSIGLLESSLVNYSYIVAGIKPWNRSCFDRVISKFPGNWYYVGEPAELTEERCRMISPRYIFFLHWSTRVPDGMVNSYECVCFHMTDVPYGRGGTPLQHLIQLGYEETKLSALRMTEELDAGPVYLKRTLALHGDAEEIYIRETALAAEMIRQMITTKIEPVPQVGEAVVFKRRKPSESEIPDLADLKMLYDFIRMLDAQTYPVAFLIHKGFRFEFTHVALREGRIVADVAITLENKL